MPPQRVGPDRAATRCSQRRGVPAESPLTRRAAAQNASCAGVKVHLQMVLAGGRDAGDSDGHALPSALHRNLSEALPFKSSGVRAASPTFKQVHAEKEVA